MEKTVLRKRKIAVISKRRNVSDFFRLEAESCSCLVSVMSVMPHTPEEYDAVIVDTEGGYTIPQAHNIYRIISGGDELGENTFVWPVAVESVRKIFEGYIVESASTVRDRDSSVLCITGEKEKAVIYKEQTIPLTESEYRVLMRLGEAEGMPVSREELRAVLGAEDGNIADVYICHLRRKLEVPFGTRIIETVRLRGYRLTVKIKA